MKRYSAAACAAATLALCPAVHAQSSSTVYGIMDGFVEFAKGDARTTKLQSGGMSGSRLGFKGTEDLGGGLKAVFQIEHGLAIDTGTVTQGGVFWGRQAYVGLSSDLGALTLGRQLNPNFLTADAGDPFGTGLGSAYSSGILTLLNGARTNNSVVYTSPKWGGFSTTLLGAAGEGVTGKFFSADVRYAAGPLAVALGLAHKDDFGAAAPEKASSVLLTGVYDFGVAALMAGVQTVKDLTQAAATEDDRTEFYIGGKAPVGPGTIMAMVASGKTKDVAGTKAKEVSLGYEYTLSKRTNLYAIGSIIDNDDNTAFTTNGATSDGPVVSAGNKVRSLGVGIRHRF